MDSEIDKTRNCNARSGLNEIASPAPSTRPLALTRDRFRRAQVLQSVLPAYGLTAHDGAQVPGIQLGTLSGSQTIVRDLEEVWAEAERLAGKVIDPLDPRFIGEETT